MVRLLSTLKHIGKNEYNFTSDFFFTFQLKLTGPFDTDLLEAR